MIMSQIQALDHPHKLLVSIGKKEYNAFFIVVWFTQIWKLRSTLRNNDK